MSKFHIAQDWLEACRDTVFFYPAAGSDYAEPLTIFGDYVDVFWFCDIDYPRSLDLPPVCSSSTNLRLIDQHRSGDPMAVLEWRTAENKRCYRFLQPSLLVETYERQNGRLLTVIRRRGFGRIALSKEFGPRSLGIFMHRGDSPGESGSNVYFLSNKKTDYEPCGNLFDKLAHRLRDRALIVSDGSNSSIRPLRRFHNKSKEGHEAFFHRAGPGNLHRVISGVSV